MGDLPAPADVGVGDEALLEERFDHPAEGVMHDAVLVGRSADHPFLGFADRKAAIGTGTIRLVPQRRLEDEQPTFRTSRMAFLAIFWKPTDSGHFRIRGAASPFVYT